MSKLLVVFGATGQQGGSVVDFVLSDTELSAQYKVRAITRNTTSEAAKALEARGAEVVAADLEKPETLKAACANAHTVFLTTAGVMDEKLVEREVATGKAGADASVAAGAQYIIYSSQMSPKKITGRAVVVFDCKNEVQEYIKTLPIKSAFYLPGSFMENWHTQQKPQPTETAGEYAVYNIIRPDRQLPAIDVAADSGKFVGAILADPERYVGKDICAASHMITLPEIAQTMSEATGKKVKYIQVPEEVYGSFLPDAFREIVCSMMAYFDEPGYYGHDTKDLVAWTQAQARGKLTTYTEFLQKNPLNLE